MKKYRILVLAVSILMAALAISGDRGALELSASVPPYYHHWANVYSLGSSGWQHSPAGIQETGDGGFAIGLTKSQNSAPHEPGRYHSALGEQPPPCQALSRKGPRPLMSAAS